MQTCLMTLRQTAQKERLQVLHNAGLFVLTGRSYHLMWQPDQSRSCHRCRHHVPGLRCGGARTRAVQSYRIQCEIGIMLCMGFGQFRLELHSELDTVSESI